jgi:hypothetical protein
METQAVRFQGGRNIALKLPAIIHLVCGLRSA